MTVDGTVVAKGKLAFAKKTLAPEPLTLITRKSTIHGVLTRRWIDIRDHVPPTGTAECLSLRETQ